jgi:hypothetical protein
MLNKVRKKLEKPVHVLLSSSLPFKGRARVGMGFVLESK